jgi:hypothetical protein
VRIDGQEAEMQAGEAVLWPTGKMHKAWADDTPFTALAIEYEGK